MTRTYIAVPVEPERAKEALCEALSGYADDAERASALGYSGPPRILRLKDKFEYAPLELKPGDWYVDTDDYQAITEVDSSGIRRHYIDGGFLALNADAGWPSRRMTPEEIQAFKTDGTFPTNNER